MGALVTLNLPADSPAQNLPWIITIGPLDETERWEPVVCGPYERPHALALAGAVVADDELLAVVEPLLPLADVETIRAELDLARSSLDVEPTDDHGAAGGEASHETRRIRTDVPPTEAEVRAGFARIAATLTDS